MLTERFKLINNLVNDLIDKEEEYGTSQLTESERAVIRVWNASGIIGNGGFQYFFEQELDPEEAASAYDAIGSHENANLLRLAVSKIPEDILNGDWKTRTNYIEKNNDLFYSLSNEFWEADEKTEERMAKYVKTHWSGMDKSSVL